VRSWQARKAGKYGDNCPHFAERLVQAWELPHTLFDPAEATAEQLATALAGLAANPGPAAILWAE
jgi:hypothetical protein